MVVRLEEVDTATPPDSKRHISMGNYNQEENDMRRVSGPAHRPPRNAKETVRIKPKCSADLVEHRRPEDGKIGDKS